MKVKWIGLVVFSAILILTLVGAGASLAMPAGGTSAPAAPGPREVTERFYAWYLGYIGPRGGAEMHNPLVDGAYKTSGYLTPAFILDVDERLASFDKGGYDPFLLAQDVPEWVKVTGVTIAGERANVTLSTSFERHLLAVRLVKTGAGWQIDGIAGRE